MTWHNVTWCELNWSTTHRSSELSCLMTAILSLSPLFSPHWHDYPYPPPLHPPGRRLHHSRGADTAGRHWDLRGEHSHGGILQLPGVRTVLPKPPPPPSPRIFWCLLLLLLLFFYSDASSSSSLPLLSTPCLSTLIRVLPLFCCLLSNFHFDASSFFIVIPPTPSLLWCLLLRWNISSCSYSDTDRYSSTICTWCPPSLIISPSNPLSLLSQEQERETRSFQLCIPRDPAGNTRYRAPPHRTELYCTGYCTILHFTIL